jgi:hypothetical protein
LSVGLLVIAWAGAQFMVGKQDLSEVLPPIDRPLVSSTISDIATSTDQISTSSPEEFVASTPALATTTTASMIAPIKTLIVPFTTQAPKAQWSDPRQQDGCEEAAVLMAMAWARGIVLDTAIAKENILAMADYQVKLYGSAVDTNAEDTLLRLIKGYWSYDRAEIISKVDKDVLLQQLSAGKLILAPTNGRQLHNPNFKAPGPETHMIAIKGYDEKTDEFIVNDPGTRKGESYRYASQVLIDAIVNYPTGNHLPQDKSQKAIIIISK